jgi:hypothetical protein
MWGAVRIKGLEEVGSLLSRLEVMKNPGLFTCQRRASSS